MNTGSLQIDESKRVNFTLSEPEDSSIRAVISGDTMYKSAMRFECLNLSPELLKGLYVEMKFERPSKIQEISMPMILTPPYKNLIAQAHNGSGKTTCFVLGMLSRIDPKLAAPHSLYLSNQRIGYSGYLDLLTGKEFVTKIVQDLFVQDYNQIFVKKEELSLDSVKQYKVQCPDELSKIMVIKDKILELGQKGYEMTTIQGALKQEDRDKIIKEFKDGLTQVLISTDLLARGFDQSQVNLVVNYDLPVRHESPTEPDHEVYLHRIGRAGRFGRKGAIFNLLCSDRDNMLMSKIENHFNHQVAEIPSWKSEEDFENALKKAGLL